MSKSKKKAEVQDIESNLRNHAIGKMFFLSNVDFTSYIVEYNFYVT